MIGILYLSHNKFAGSSMIHSTQNVTFWYLPRIAEKVSIFNQSETFGLVMRQVIWAPVKSCQVEGRTCKNHVNDRTLPKPGEREKKFGYDGIIHE